MPEASATLGMFGVIVVEDPAAPPADRENIVFLHDIYVPALVAGVQLHQRARVHRQHADVHREASASACVGGSRRSATTSTCSICTVTAGSTKGRFDDSSFSAPRRRLTFDYVEDNPGDWLYHCHVAMHMMGGMIGRYRVSS